MINGIGVLGALHIAIGILVIALSVPLLMGWVPMNLRIPAQAEH